MLRRQEELRQVLAPDARREYERHGFVKVGLVTWHGLPRVRGLFLAAVYQPGMLEAVPLQEVLAGVVGYRLGAQNGDDVTELLLVPGLASGGLTGC